jgi:oxepin-CoA hydrolase/3-oxo-5,6-dehydrosuberyl-CoA semialdehyde dehydrogenase
MEVGKSGLVFEDCAVGRRVEGGNVKVENEMIRAFAELTGDRNPVHVDPEVARKSVFRGCVAHGMLVQSLAAGMMWRSGAFEGSVIAVLEARASFPAPVKPGDEVTAVLEVRAVDPEPAAKRGWVLWSVELRNQRSEVVCESEWKVLTARRR